MHLTASIFFKSRVYLKGLYVRGELPILFTYQRQIFKKKWKQTN